MEQLPEWLYFLKTVMNSKSLKWTYFIGHNGDIIESLKHIKKFYKVQSPLS